MNHQPYILVFEDDPVLGKVAIQAAKQVGVLAVLDQNGNEYHNILRERGLPKAILLDLHLPFASGADLLKEFHANERFQGIPVLVLTADILQARVLQEAGERVLLKPISPTKLQEILLQLER